MPGPVLALGDAAVNKTWPVRSFCVFSFIEM